MSHQCVQENQSYLPPHSCTGSIITLGKLEMNMASLGTLFLIVALISLTAGIANAVFVKVQCQANTVGQIGQQALLQCVVKATAKDATIRVVTWRKNEAKYPSLVFHAGETTPQPGFKFAEPSWDDKNMNVSLLITNTKLSDAGVYTCMVVTDSGDDKSEINLDLIAKYSAPTIHSTPKKIEVNADGTLMCDSDGGYPKGHIRWFDESNTDWTKSSEMEVQQRENGLFRLSSKLTLRSGSIFSKYTCVVYNASGGKEAEATYEVEQQSLAERGGGSKSYSASKVVAPVVVIGSLIVGLLLALLIYRRRSQRDHHEVCRLEVECEAAHPQKMDEYGQKFQV
ncbi:V-set domain-containing T-cell activation inhibitor 1 isoform X2 [Trachinotus anak]|uniref:V-set domain-containing T-cell activation inhibitor 1 isoform X2 n=2 Tax=Trachinotus anak TaxID=443729 RepID=UPI0039F1D1F3